MKGCDYEGGKKKGKGKKRSKMTGDHDRCGDMACLMVIVMVMMKLTQLL